MYAVFQPKNFHCRVTNLTQRIILLPSPCQSFFDFHLDIERLLAQENKSTFEVKIKDKVLNQVKALWTQSKNNLSDDDYKSFYKQFCHDHEDPEHYLHFSIDAPIQYHALIYFPKNISNEFVQLRSGSKQIFQYFSINGLITSGSIFFNSSNFFFSFYSNILSGFAPKKTALVSSVKDS